MRNVFFVFFVFFNRAILVAEFKRQTDRKNSTYVLFALKINTAVHLINKFFYNSHSKSASAKLGSCACIFLRKRLKNMGTVFLAHANSSISTVEFNISISTVNLFFSNTNFNSAVFLVVLYGIACNIHQNTL